MKAFIRSNTVQTVAGVLVAAYMRLIRATTRWTVTSPPAVDAAWRGAGGGVETQTHGLVACLWHSRLMLAYSVWRKDQRRAGILISRSPDGEFVAKASRRLDLAVMRGSTRNPKKDKGKGGAAAFREMLEFVQDGGCMCLMPDGPRGPRMRARPGAVRLAAAAQAPLLPFAASTKARILFKSWDRFVLPLPFSRGVVIWGEPIAPPPIDAEPEALEEKRLELEAALIAVNQAADRAINGEVVEPAPETISTAFHNAASSEPTR